MLRLCLCLCGVSEWEQLEITCGRGLLPGGHWWAVFNVHSVLVHCGSLVVNCSAASVHTGASLPIDDYILGQLKIITNVNGDCIFVTAHSIVTVC